MENSYWRVQTLRCSGHTDDLDPPVTNLCGEGRIALVDLSQPVQHFWQLWWVDRLHCDLYNGCCVELERPENLSLSEKKCKKCEPRYIWRSQKAPLLYLTSSFPLGSVIVAVLTMGWSQPSMRTQLPAGTRFTSIWYLKRWGGIMGFTTSSDSFLTLYTWRNQIPAAHLATEIQRRPTVQTWESSSSSRV